MVTEACHLASKQLEELMDDDCHNPVLATNGRDPMLSSPHLGSPHDVMSSPASSHSGHYSNHSHDDLSDTMDLAVTACQSGTSLASHGMRNSDVASTRTLPC